MQKGEADQEDVEDQTETVTEQDPLGILQKIDKLLGSFNKSGKNRLMKYLTGILQESTIFLLF